MIDEAGGLFSSQLPRLRLRWDATALTALWTCPQKYYRQMVQGVGRGGSSRHLVFGKGLHRGLEVLHNSRWIGASEEEGINAAIKAALTEVGWRDGEEWNAWRSLDKIKNARSLIRALVWYADDLARGEGGEVKTWTIPVDPDLRGRPATEVYSEVELPFRAVTGEAYTLCGNVDRYVEWDSDVWRMEVKTTKSDPSAFDGGWWEGWNPSVQIKTYDLLDSLAHPEWAVVGTLLEAHQVGVGFARWSRMPLRYAEDTREQWLVEIEEKLREMEKWCQACEVSDDARDDARQWPSNYTACHGFGEGCPLRSVCRRPWAEREKMLIGVERNVWDPKAR